MILVGPGQREAVLVQFTKPGTYQVMQGVLDDFAEDDANVGPVADSEDIPMAFFEVADASANLVPVDISSLQFTPGRPATPPALTAQDNQHDMDITFTVGN